MLGSDIGHFDVEDMRGVLEEAHELVDHGLMSSEDFRRFALENPVRLHGGMNKDFFKGTKVEAEAKSSWLPTRRGAPRPESRWRRLRTAFDFRSRQPERDAHFHNTPEPLSRAAWSF
jgi:hypothetical protein